MSRLLIKKLINMKKIISTFVAISILVVSPVALFAAGTTTGTTVTPAVTQKISPQEQTLLKKLKQTKQKSKVTRQKIKTNISQNKKVVSKVKKDRSTAKKLKTKSKKVKAIATSTPVR